MIILSLDIGITTGFCIFDYEKEYILQNQDLSGRMLVQGQLPKLGLATELLNFIEYYKVEYIVMESFNLYASKAMSKIGSSFPEVELIGLVTYLCDTKKIPYCKQMAVHAKKTFTDERLKEHNVYIKGQQHSRDSIRHALYFICFNMKKYKKEAK